MADYQNTILHKQIKIGDIYKDIKVVTTNKKVICYNSKDEEIGQAGVLRQGDFNFNKLYKIALSKSKLTEA